MAGPAEEAKADTVTESCHPMPLTCKADDLSFTGEYEQQCTHANAAFYYHCAGWQAAMQHLYPYPLAMPSCDYGAFGWSSGQQRQRQSQCHDRGTWRARAEVKGDGGDVESKGGGGLTGCVWLMARDAVGCRALQKALDQGDDEKRAALGQELKYHVWEAIECKNANHVIQKYIVVMGPDASQFIIDEIMTQLHGVWRAVRHCFGCRVVERLLEHCRKTQVQSLVAEILHDAADLCKHQYGNYVVQHLFQHGAPEHQHQLAKVVQKNALSMCTDYHAVAVVSQALCSGTPEDRVSVARSILNQPGLVLSMARSRHGQEAVKHLIRAPRDDVREEVWRLLTDNLEKLQCSRYGRVVAKHLSSQHAQPCGIATPDDEAH